MDGGSERAATPKAEEAAGLLAEYEMLQGEIGRNSEVTAHVFAITITAVAALIGYGVETRNWLVFVGAFAVLAPSLWFVASQLESTVRIASYVRTCVEPELDGLEWETRLGRLRRSSHAPDSRYTVSITGIYGALSFACLALAWVFAPMRVPEAAVLAVLTAVLATLTGVLVVRVRSCFSTRCYEEYAEAWARIAAGEPD